jgi:hypothetical protein
MASQRKDTVNSTAPKRAPASSPEQREKQIIALSYDTAEKMIAKGEASSQVITHFLKLGSSRERLEQDRLRNENELLKKKVEALESAKDMVKLYEGAINAMREYSGQDPPMSDFDG